MHRRGVQGVRNQVAAGSVFSGVFRRENQPKRAALWFGLLLFAGFAGDKITTHRAEMDLLPPAGEVTSTNEVLYPARPAF
jgi:hypothetical protein